MDTPENRADRINITVGAATVLIAVAFWIQRNHTTQFGGTWADPVIIGVGALGLLLLVLGVLRRRVGGTGEDGEEDALPVRGLVTAGVLLVAWIVSLPFLGYVISGVVFFLLTALAMRKERPGIRGLLLDVVIAGVVVGAVYLVFTEVLYVRLPPPAF